MSNPTYEPIDENLDLPVTRADIARILRAIEILSEQISDRNY